MCSRSPSSVLGDDRQSLEEVEVLLGKCAAPSLLSRLEVLDNLLFCASDSLDNDELLLEVTVLEIVGVLQTAKARVVPELEMLLCKVQALGQVHGSVSTFNEYLCQSDRSPRAVQWLARAQSPQ